MDENELKEIEARANAATPGPWSTGEGVEYKDLESVRACGWDCRRVPSTNDYFACGPRVACSLSAEMDANFIAHAREDIPALIAEVRRLTTGADIQVHCPHCKKPSLTVVTGGGLIKNEPGEELK